jgi:ABC-2 type transport system permease protein
VGPASRRSTTPSEASPGLGWLLLPSVWALRNRARRRERGDAARFAVFAAIGAVVFAAIFAITFWLTWQLLDYEELGEYLVRLGLSWLFLTFLSFLAFSALVTSLSTFFLSEDLRLLLAAPVSPDPLFHSRFLRTLGQSSWMVVTFLAPVLLALGLVRCAGPGYWIAIPLTLLPFVVIPATAGAGATLFLVNVFPARRARDILMLMGLLFAVGLVLLLRFLRPERLLSVDSLPDVTAFFATLQSPVTPFLPSFWAGEALFSALQGSVDWLHLGCLWSTALAFLVLARAAYARSYFAGWSKAQEARKARFTRLDAIEGLAMRLPAAQSSRALLVKDVKVFLRDTAQWSQLLLLVALGLVYLYNFHVLDLSRIPFVSDVVKDVYAFVNLSLAAFVVAAVAVRFVFPAVSVEGPAFWIVRTSPVSMRSFLRSKLWTGLVPVVLMAEGLTVLSNRFLGVDPFLEVVDAAAMLFLCWGLLGLAAGMGARFPRFEAENVTQVAGSYGGIAFMACAVLFILVEVALLAWPCSIYLWHQYHDIPLQIRHVALMGVCFLAMAFVALLVAALAFEGGVRALDDLGG